MENIIISNPVKLEKTKEAIRKDGINNLHILADFDRTLTKTFVDHKKVWSLLGVLREGNILPEEYNQKAKKLFDYYHPLEIDQSLSLVEKKKLMGEWWQKAFDLMVEFSFNKEHLQKIANSGQIQFRDNANDFFSILQKNNIPLIVMSASGVGEAINLFFEKTSNLFNNIFIISNAFEWDTNGNAKSIKQPIIHSLNKDETLIQNFPKIYEKIANRKNIILLGDNIEDIAMAEGFDYDNIIKISFLNENENQLQEQYKNNFDITILNDGSMDSINKLMIEIVEI